MIAIVSLINTLMTQHIAHDIGNRQTRCLNGITRSYHDNVLHMKVHSNTYQKLKCFFFILRIFVLFNLRHTALTDHFISLVHGHGRAKSFKQSAHGCITIILDFFFSFFLKNATMISSMSAKNNVDAQIKLK